MDLPTTERSLAADWTSKFEHSSRKVADTDLLCRVILPEDLSSFYTNVIPYNGLPFKLHAHQDGECVTVNGPKKLCRSWVGNNVTGSWSKCPWDSGRGRRGYKRQPPQGYRPRNENGENLPLYVDQNNLLWFSDLTELLRMQLKHAQPALKRQLSNAYQNYRY